MSFFDLRTTRTAKNNKILIHSLFNQACFFSWTIHHRSIRWVIRVNRSLAVDSWTVFSWYRKAACTMTLAEPHWHYLVLRCFKLNFRLRISWVLDTVWEVYNQLSLLFLPQISRLLPCISHEWPRNEKFGLAVLTYHLSCICVKIGSFLLLQKHNALK